MQVSLCRECDQPLERNATKCPHCGCSDPLASKETEEDRCWMCGGPAVPETDMEGKRVCANHFVQACWACLDPVRRSDAWKLSTRRATYYFHYPKCYEQGKKKIRKLGKFVGADTIICDPRDPQGRFATASGCMGILVVALLALAGVVMAVIR